MKPERILVTGATGFIGRHLVAHLLERGHDLSLAVRRADACPEAWRSHPSIRIFETGPIETAANLGEALSGVSCVIHLAGLAHVHASDGSGGEEAFMAANAEATARLTHAAAGQDGMRCFILLGSLAAVTGNAASARIDDATPPIPVTAYGRSKLEAERHVLSLSEKDIVSICLRPPLVVGSDAIGNWGMFLKLAATGLPLPFASIRNRRSMIGVRTLVEAIAWLCGQRWPVAQSGAYAIADPDPMSLPQIVTELRSGMGMGARLVPFPPGILYGMAKALGRQRRAAGLLGDLEVDASRFSGAFGFQPSQDLPGQIRDAGAAYAARRRTNTRNPA